MQDDARLFADDAAAAPVPAPAPAAVPAPPRLRRPDRAQVLLRPCSLEQLIDDQHPARVVWAVVERWDLSALLASIKARGESPGRAATDPRLLVGLWLLAHTRGVGGGRELARLCEEHDAYRWMCGGVSLNYHTLCDFRVDHEQTLDGLLTQMVAALTRGGLVEVTRISQDGTRVRAGAGRGSFKGRAALAEHLRQAREHVEALKREGDDPALPARRKAARERAARERAERVEAAVGELEQIEAAKARQKDKPSKGREARASETDPHARLMRMPGGGTAPAYNVQLAVATGGRAVVGVGVTNAGSDAGESQPMRRQVQERTGRAVEEQLVDGGYVALGAITAAAEQGVRMYAPVPRPRKAGVDPHAPKPGDSEGVRQWRARMATDAAKAVYRERASTVETVNGECKTYRGLTQMRVRGPGKVRCVALWCALAYNLVHFGAALAA